MILYFSYAGRIKQRILCCRKFIIMFGSSDLFIEQLLALAECRLLKFSFRAWQKYCVLSLLSLDRFSKGILINISSKKNAFVRVLLRLSAILKLDFLKSPENPVVPGPRAVWNQAITWLKRYFCVVSYGVWKSMMYHALLFWSRWKLKTL